VAAKVTLKHQATLHKEKKEHLLNLPDNRRTFLSEAQIDKIRQQFYETTANLFLNF
jgi:hypothetical protein